VGQTGGVRALRFRDRFYTTQVARAITSPLGIVLAGAGLAVGLGAGLPIIAAVALGVGAYGARVAVAIPRGIDADGVDPFSLDEPWRTYVWQARKARRHFADAVKAAKDGPLRNRLLEIEERIALGVEESWRVAQQGQNIARARARIDIAAVTKQLSDLYAMNPTPPPIGSPMAQTMQAVQAQLDTAKRLDAVIADTDARLRLLGARLDESVTRTIELSARVGSVDDLGSVLDDVDVLVGDLEALRQALGETDEMTTRKTGTPMLPSMVPTIAGLPTSANPTATANPSTAPHAATSPPSAPTPVSLPGASHTLSAPSIADPALDVPEPPSQPSMLPDPTVVSPPPPRDG